MRFILMSFVLLLPSSGAVAAPKTPQTSRPSTGRPIRVSLVNMSGRPRQLLLKGGVLNLPESQRIDIDSHVGDTLHIVSNLNSKLHEDIRIQGNDDSRMIQIM